MNGGLVRVSNIKDTLLVSSKSGGTSKDLWILGVDSMDDSPIDFLTSKYVQTSIDEIPTTKS